jgi:hypothetical protein
MTAEELVATLRMLGPQDASVIFTFLADHAYDSTLRSGQKLRDVTDFAIWLRELAEVARLGCYPNGHGPVDTAPAGIRTRPKVMRAAQPRWQDTCPRCGHVHQGEAECGEQMGGGRICRCEVDVPA